MVPFAAAAKEPWRVLLMSDGVWKYGGWDRVIEIACRASGSAIVTELQRLVRLPGSGCFQDDFTVVVLESLADSDAAAAGCGDIACSDSPVA
ncbi:MAG: hypothetical protein FJ276_14710 [Planctomycetes bacterium]|nr:hypothetical protein [Planctomycetota bacterium]